MFGMCPECGLQFAWGDVLNADRRRLAGFVEHENGWARLPGAMVRTAWWTLRPKSFWRRVTLFMPIRLRRAVLLVVVAIIGLWIVRNVLGAMYWLTYPPPKAFPTAGSVRLDWIGTELVAPFWDGRRETAGGRSGIFWGVPPLTWQRTLGLMGELSLVVVALVAVTIMTTVTILSLPYVRKAAKVRPAHVLRASIYSIMWLVFVPIFMIAHVIHMIVDPPSISSPSLGGIGSYPIGTLILKCAWWIFVPLSIVWFVSWWIHAIGSWRLKDRAPVALSLIVIGVLTFLIFVGPAMIHHGWL